MNKILLILFYLIAISTVAQEAKYIAYMDLNKVEDDKVQVLVDVPNVNSDEAEYHIPKIVPGTYSISDFGRFVTEFKAIDAKGNVLESEKISENKWLIKGAKDLDKISYWVEDTYDTDKGNVIFEPAGTNIEAGKSFVINTFGFLRLFKGY